MNAPLADNPYAYPPPIWQRFLRPECAGRFAPDAGPVLAGQAGTPAARSVLRLELLMDEAGERVREARFQAYGCPASIAVGAWIAGWVPGRSRGELAALSAARLRAELEIPEDRAHCALMGEDALRAALHSRSAS